MSAEEAETRKKNDGWDVVEDAGRGWRRVVASPKPKRIIEEFAVKKLLDEGIVVITVGGGGIPVIADERGKLRGIAAVIDKDNATSLLATNLNADLFLITTAVEKVSLNFGKPNEKQIDQMTLAETKKYFAEGIHFAKGSMEPKIKAIINFLENGGKEALITSPPNIERALRGETGTRFI